MEATLRQYDAVTRECLALFARKAGDYGASWRVMRLPSLTDQVFIKAQRLRTLEVTGSNQVGEDARGELVAIVNYAAMALVQAELGVPDRPDMDGAEAVRQVGDRIAQARALMRRKNHDYGEAWRSMRPASLVDLILVKLLRIKQIEDNRGVTVASEGVESNYLDILNYAVFALILTDEARSLASGGE
jgi:hypothetical protein